MGCCLECGHWSDGEVREDTKGKTTLESRLVTSAQQYLDGLRGGTIQDRVWLVVSSLIALRIPQREKLCEWGWVCMRGKKSYITKSFNAGPFTQNAQHLALSHPKLASKESSESPDGRNSRGHISAHLTVLEVSGPFYPLRNYSPKIILPFPCSQCFS